MKKFLVDAGPLIALFNNDDDYHDQVVDFLKGNRGRMFSTWPVATEVGHFLSFSIIAQLDFLTFIERGGLYLEEVTTKNLSEIMRLMARYRDRPMDFADASLLVLANRMGINEIISLDKDFLVYRLNKNKRFKNLLFASS